MVYAYVIGFVGNSTGNSGSTTDTLSIDQLTLKGSTLTSIPVTTFVRNEGPSSEAFNTGFYVKASSLNELLGPALVLSGSGTTDTLTAVALSGVSGTPTSLTVTLTITYSLTTDLITVQAFGSSVTSASGNCATGMTVTWPLYRFRHLQILRPTWYHVSINKQCCQFTLAPLTPIC